MLKGVQRQFIQKIHYMQRLLRSLLKIIKCRYTTIQNCSNNIVNLVTKRAVVDRYGQMEWIDGNIGSMVNMKYPACVLRGEGAKGTTISIAFAGVGQIQDAGAKMIHLAPNTSSNIISKSICRGGGQVDYRGLVKHTKRAKMQEAGLNAIQLFLIVNQKVIQSQQTLWKTNKDILNMKQQYLV